MGSRAGASFVVLSDARLLMVFAEALEASR
jgi:hypothetical protein